MREGGLAEIERAKADGRWEAAYRMSTIEPDEQFQAALDASPKAKAFWDKLGRTKKFPFLLRSMGIKAEAKAERISTIIRALEKGNTLR